jgi:azobenzene reductase
MKTMILVGSGDEDSHSLHLAMSIQKQLQADGAKADIVNLVELGLPLYDRGVERNDDYNELTRDFLDKSYKTDAFVWVTPIYHNSFSAILKNALDWQHTKFSGKVVGLASNGGDRSAQAVDQLMIIARAQHLIASRVRVCTDTEDFDDSLNITNSSILDRIKSFSAELISLQKRMVDTSH